MIAQRVSSEAEIHEILKGMEFSKTGHNAPTGTFWRHRKTKRHLLVPFPVQGYYPDWLLWGLLSHATDISGELPKKKPSSSS